MLTAASRCSVESVFWLDSGTIRTSGARAQRDQGGVDTGALRAGQSRAQRRERHELTDR